MLAKLIMPPAPGRKIDGISVYKLYLMVKQHFNGRYDCVKYNWNMNVSTKAYEKRNDKYFFARLSEKYTLGELYQIFVANMLANPDAWVGEISGADAIQFYRQHQGKLERAAYIYKEDIENMVDFCRAKGRQFKDLFDCSNGQPFIFKMIQQEIISYETFLLIDAAGRFIHKFDAAMDDDIVWIEYRKRINGYKLLLDINSTEAKNILLQTLKNSV